MKKILIINVILMSLLLMACQSMNKSNKFNVVATTTMIGDLLHEIGKDNVSVTTLMGVGVDPHLYTPKLSDTLSIKNSSLVVFNGLHLEGKMTELLEGASNVATLSLGDTIATKGVIYEAADEVDAYDPHIWFDVTNWMIAAEAVGEKLASLDEENSAYYLENAKNYIEKLRELDTWIFDEVNQLTEAQKILVTAHDAFQYFAKRYGFEVASIQGISTDGEPSVKDINDLIDLVIKKNVKAIFVESSIPDTTIMQVINGAKARNHVLIKGNELFADSLGDGIYSNYIEALKYNIESIVEALK